MSKLKLEIKVVLNKQKATAVSKNDRALAVAVDQVSDELEFFSEDADKDCYKKAYRLKREFAETEFEQLVELEPNLAEIPMNLSGVLKELEDFLLDFSE